VSDPAQHVASPTRSRAGGKRRRGREMALQMLYQLEMGEATVRQVVGNYDPFEQLEAERDEEGTRSRVSERLLRDAFEYGRKLVEGTEGHRDEVDELIRGQADNWRLERMSVVDRNILRLAVFELLFEPDVPKRVVLDEAIELAKRFGSDQSSRFVNGILDGLLRSHAFPGSME